MSLGPATSRNAIPLSPPRISLLSAAVLIDEKDERWQNGYGIIPEACDSDTNDVIPVDICGTYTSGFDSDAVRYPDSWFPFGIVESDTAGAFGWQIRDYQARATRKLIATEAKKIEAEFMLSTLGNNPAVAAPSATAVDLGVALSPIHMLAAVENGIAAGSGGNRGLIHMRPGLLTLLLAQGAPVRREGDTWLTPSDNIIVPGRGYPGTGPSAEAVTLTAEWVYVTGMVQVRRGPISIWPDELGQAMNRKTNDITYYASRIVATDWDAGCLHLSCKVNSSTV